MKTDKTLLVIFWLITGFTAPWARLQLLGWLMIFGIASVLFFGILHIIYLTQVVKKYDLARPPVKMLAWIGALSYPLIFLFQFEIDDSSGTYFVHELFTGFKEPDFNGFPIGIGAALTYIVSFILWKVKTNGKPTKAIQTRN